MYRVCIGNVSKAMGRVGGGVPTTDEHGWARKHGDIINDNIDNLRPNQYYLGAKRSRLLTTDGHGFARKHGNTETLRYGNTEIYDYNNLNNINQQQLHSQQHSER